MSFSVFNFDPQINEAIKKCGFLAPTSIQQKAIAPLLEGHDMLGLAQTGTGKTAAFVLPTVQHLLKKPAKQVRTLIMAPTRELAEQIYDFIEQIVENTSLKSMAIYGGVSKNGQIARLRKGIDIVVACPGRLLDIIKDKAIDLSRVEILVLDEADHMFDQGVLPDIKRVLKQLPRKKQSLVFSATMPKEIRHLAEEILYKPVTVQINHTVPINRISHKLFDIDKASKTKLLLHLLKNDEIKTTLVFTKTKYKAKNLANKLTKSGFKATSLQGNLSQNRRQEALAGFKDGTYNILVATDIAARGIDVTSISHVINYDVPDTTEAYIHRTGRTGRATHSGEAYTFATVEDWKIIRLIEKAIEKKIPRENVSLPVGAFPQRGEDGSIHAEKRKGSVSSRKVGVSRKKHSKCSKREGSGSSVFGLNSCCKS